MRKLLRRPSPAMVVACLALLVALGGTGMAAATQLARNSVGTPQLKDSAVSNPKIKNNAINSAKVAARSLLRSDFAPGQLPAGPTGPQGPAGPTGAAGAAGLAGVVGAITVRHELEARERRDGPRTARTTASVTPACARGTSAAISGGTSWSDDAAGARTLMTGELEPQLNAQNQVVRVPRRRTERQRRDNSTFTVYVALLHA